MKTGPFCAQDGQATAAVAAAAPNNRVVAMLSVILPGAGHMYRGQTFGGLAWLVGVAIGYLFIVPGLVLHMLCILCVICGDDL